MREPTEAAGPSDAAREGVGRQAEWAAAVWRASNARLWPKRRQEAKQRPGKEMAAREKPWAAAAAGLRAKKRKEEGFYIFPISFQSKF